MQQTVDGFVLFIGPKIQLTQIDCYSLDAITPALSFDYSEITLCWAVLCRKYVHQIYEWTDT